MCVCVCFLLVFFFFVFFFFLRNATFEDIQQFDARLRLQIPHFTKIYFTIFLNDLQLLKQIGEDGR